MVGKFVIVRCSGAGVHMGTLVDHTSDGCVRLSDARRLWRWDSGANTLNEVAVRGLGDDCRISEPVEEILLFGAQEVIPCTDAAASSLSRSRWS